MIPKNQTQTQGADKPWFAQQATPAQQTALQQSAPSSQQASAAQASAAQAAAQQLAAQQKNNTNQAAANATPTQSATLQKVTQGSGTPTPGQVDHNNLGAFHYSGSGAHPQSLAYLESNFWNWSTAAKNNWLNQYNSQFGTNWYYDAGSNSIDYTGSSTSGGGSNGGNTGGSNNSGGSTNPRTNTGGTSGGGGSNNSGGGSPGNINPESGIPTPGEVDHTQLYEFHWFGEEHPTSLAYLEAGFWGWSTNAKNAWLTTYNQDFGTRWFYDEQTNTIKQGSIAPGGAAAGGGGGSGVSGGVGFSHGGGGGGGGGGVHISGGGVIGGVGGLTGPPRVDIYSPGSPGVRQMDADLIDPSAYGSLDSTTYQMRDVGDADPYTSVAVDAQGYTVEDVYLSDDAQQATSTHYDAATTQGASDIQGAQGTVSDGAQAQHVDQQLTQQATAAQRDATAEMQSLATTPAFQLSSESLAIAQVDSQPIQAQAAIADLPPEALVSNQIEELLSGLDDGNIPSWARPAVDAATQAMAARGIEASTIARDAMYNAIIGSAIPIAQSNAEAIQQRARDNLANQQQANMVTAEFEQQLKITNLSNRQQTALQNAGLQGNLDLAKFSAEQQTALSNSQFAQTMTLTDFTQQQQAAMLNATNMANMDLANLDAYTRLAAQNAQAFLQMDLANLSNEQQATVLNQQTSQQTMLSNQAAENAARQFNAASDTQTSQFMSNLAAQIDQFNVTQSNAMSQYNVAELNRLEAQNAQNATQVGLANAQILNAVDQFNIQIDQQREQFNVTNRQAIEQADLAWRRQVNTVNTAAVNAANQLNVQNAFAITYLDQQNYWQQMRDTAAYIRESYENYQTRATSLYAASIGNEAAASSESETSSEALLALIANILGV